MNKLLILKKNTKTTPLNLKLNKNSLMEKSKISKKPWEEKMLMPKLCKKLLLNYPPPKKLLPTFSKKKNNTIMVEITVWISLWKMMIILSNYPKSVEEDSPPTNFLN